MVYHKKIYFNTHSDQTMQGGFVFVPTNEKRRGSWFDQWGAWCPPKSNVSFIERKMGIYGHLCFTLSILQKEQVGCFVILYYVSNVDQVSRLRNTLLVWVEQQHRTLSTVKKDHVNSINNSLLWYTCGVFLSFRDRQVWRQIQSTNQEIWANRY